MENKIADTAVPVHQLLAGRWSPRAFDPASTISEPQLTALLEAARWSPSAMNSQPWRFLVARRGTPEFTAVFEALMQPNQVWAGNADVLLVVAARTEDADGNPLRHAFYDTGQAVAHLSTQAEHEGLAVHQMGGFHADAVAEAFALPSTVTPVVVVAIGIRTHADTLPAGYAEREVAPRSRLPLSDLLLTPVAAEPSVAA
jgi:nitroreductase